MCVSRKCWVHISSQQPGCLARSQPVLSLPGQGNQSALGWGPENWPAPPSTGSRGKQPRDVHVLKISRRKRCQWQMLQEGAPDISEALHMQCSYKLSLTVGLKERSAHHVHSRLFLLFLFSLDFLLLPTSNPLALCTPRLTTCQVAHLDCSAHAHAHTHTCQGSLLVFQKQSIIQTFFIVFFSLNEIPWEAPKFPGFDPKAVIFMLT